MTRTRRHAPRMDNPFAVEAPRMGPMPSARNSARAASRPVDRVMDVVEVGAVGMVGIGTIGALGNMIQK